MRTLTPIVLSSLLLVCGDVSAQEPSVEVGTPAALSDGSSSTTLSLLGGAISVGVAGEGGLDIHTRSGTVEGDGTVTGSINTMSLSVGGQIPALRLDQDGDGAVSAEESAAARSFGEQSGDCRGSVVSTSSVSDIEAVDAHDTIDILLICAGTDGLTAEQRAAIEGNAALMDRITAAGFGAGDVVGVSLGTSGSGIVYLAA